MKRQETHSEPTRPDERLEEALDRLGALVSPEPAAEDAFVRRVMQQVHGTAIRRRAWPSGRRLLGMAVGAAACVAAALALWQTMSGRRAPQPAAVQAKQLATVATADESDLSAEVMRTSTWSVVTEGVVLEDDVPVRKLLYREFQRVEVLDSQGNIEGSLVVPTKAMLLASAERY